MIMATVIFTVVLTLGSHQLTEVWSLRILRGLCETRSIKGEGIVRRDPIQNDSVGVASPPTSFNSSAG